VFWPPERLLAFQKVLSSTEIESEILYKLFSGM